MAEARSPGDLEKKHVRQVYDEIASHFSDTRHKPWPLVAHFINSLPHGSTLADIGCGNGKYIAVNPKVIKIGLDSCSKLVQIAVQQGFDACVGDCLRLPFRSNVFNAAICIAVIHHLATEDRRIKALKELVRIVEPGGKVLIYVWAFEQKKRKFEGQDVMVPWHLQAKYKDVQSAADPMHSNKPPQIQLEDRTDLVEQGYTTFQRYYHVFKEGELSAMVRQNLSNVTIIEDYFDHENWCVILEKAAQLEEEISQSKEEIAQLNQPTK